MPRCLDNLPHRNRIGEIAMPKHGPLFVASMLFAFLPALAPAADNIFMMTKRGNFEDVRDDVVMAIEGRGIKINHSNYIADMLERTGRDLGATRQVYVQGEQVEFCRTNLSRAQMEADPANMVFCPYIISIYTTPQDPQLVHVAFRKPEAPNASLATRTALKGVEKLLADIVMEALQ
jgi:hypothetical protein